MKAAAVVCVLAVGALYVVALGPTGPVAWSELAALVARGGDRG